MLWRNYTDSNERQFYNSFYSNHEPEYSVTGIDHGGKKLFMVNENEPGAVIGHYWTDAAVGVLTYEGHPNKTLDDNLEMVASAYYPNGEQKVTLKFKDNYAADFETDNTGAIQVHEMLSDYGSAYLAIGVIDLPETTNTTPTKIESLYGELPLTEAIII
jgi:hypothetical protein